MCANLCCPLCKTVLRETETVTCQAKAGIRETTVLNPIYLTASTPAQRTPWLLPARNACAMLGSTGLYGTKPKGAPAPAVNNRRAEFYHQRARLTYIYIYIYTLLTPLFGARRCCDKALTCRPPKGGVFPHSSAADAATSIIPSGNQMSPPCKNTVKYESCLITRWGSVLLPLGVTMN